MTLAELRRLSDSVHRIPWDGDGPPPPEVAAFNDSVTRFRELVVLVRNRIVLAEPGHDPAGVTEVRELARSLAARRVDAAPGWMAGQPPGGALRAPHALPR